MFYENNNGITKNLVFTIRLLIVVNSSKYESDLDTRHEI